MKPRHAAALVAALFSIAFLVGIAIVSAATDWTVTITGPGGGKHVYAVSTDTEAEAIEAGWDAHRAAQRSIVAVPVGPPPPGSGYPSIPASEIDFDGDFDSGCSIFNGQGGWPNDVSGNGTKVIVRDRVGEGACAGKFTYPGGSGSRSEISQSTTAPNPSVEYEFLAYLPSGTSHVGFIAQNKQGGSGGGCANGGVSIANTYNPARVELVTRASCGAENRRFDLGTFPRDQWFAIRVIESFSNSGLAQAFIDTDGPAGPNDYVERLAPTAVDNVSDTGVGMKFRFGPYGDGPSNASIWLDGYRMDFLP